MARIVRDVGRALWIVLPLLVVGFLLLHPLPMVHGATYTDPYYANASSPRWCACLTAAASDRAAGSWTRRWATASP